MVYQKYVIENRKSGCLIGSPTNNSELYSAFRYLEKNIDTASKEARQAFISNYYYKKFLAIQPKSGYFRKMIN